jgi:hypothetical protein
MILITLWDIYNHGFNQYKNNQCSAFTKAMWLATNIDHVFNLNENVPVNSK